MNYPNNIIYNSDIRFQKIVAILICFTIILIPISIIWLYYLITPTDTINGYVTNKRTKTIHVNAGASSINYFVIINNREFNVSNNIYEKLAIGVYISAAYRKNLMYYFSR